MRVGRQAATADFLTESIQLFFTQTTFKEGAGVDARRGVAREEDLVRGDVLVATGFDLAAPL